MGYLDPPADTLALLCLNSIPGPEITAHCFRRLVCATRWSSCISILRARASTTVSSELFGTRACIDELAIQCLCGTAQGIELDCSLCFRFLD